MTCTVPAQKRLREIGHSSCYNGNFKQPKLMIFKAEYQIILFSAIPTNDNFFWMMLAQDLISWCERNDRYHWNKFLKMVALSISITKWMWILWRVYLCVCYLFISTRIDEVARACVCTVLQTYTRQIEK